MLITEAKWAFSAERREIALEPAASLARFMMQKQFAA